MTTTRFALCGLGHAARTIHLPAFAKLDRVEVVGGHDPGVAGEHPFPLYDDPRRMIDETRPDVLVVASPTDTHFELAALGLDAGCHVLCEKPFMPSLEQAARIVERARDAGRHVVVNNQYRFMDIHQAARAAIGTEAFGELLFVSAHQTFHATERTEAGWRGTDTQRTCKEFGIHVIDLCRFFFADDPLSIHARMPRADRPGGPDYLDLLTLEFPGDRVAHVTLDRLSRGRHSYLDMRLDGTEGCVETHLGGGIELVGGVRGGSRRPYLHLDVSMGGRARLYHGERFRKLASDPIDLFAHATAKLTSAFLEALDRREVPPCDGSDNIRTLELMLAAYASDAEGRPVVPSWA